MSDDVTDEMPPAGESAGSLLRQARETAGMSVQEVAEKLHLKTDLITALESDNTDAFPSAVFTLGYLRRYSKLLNIDAEKVIAASAVSKEDAEESVHTLYQPHSEQIGAPRRAPSNFAFGKLFALLLLIAMAAVIALWWLGIIKVPGVSPDRLNELLPFPVEQSLQDSPGDESLVIPGLTATPAESTTAIAPQVLPPIIAPAVTEPVPEPAIEAVVAEPEASTEIALTIEPQPEPALEVINEELTLEEAVASVTATEAPVSTTPASAEALTDAGIVLQFDQNCWIDVRDKSGKALHNGMIEAGDTRRVEGQGPFSFILGNVAAVTMLVNGEPYDMSAHTRGQVARFTYDLIQP